MAKEPIQLMFEFEVIIDDGVIPPGVTLETIQAEIDTAVWGVVVPHLNVKATRKRCRPSKGHVHDGTAPCQHHIDAAYNERNKFNV
jgi:hypothetical protein